MVVSPEQHRDAPALLADRPGHAAAVSALKELAAGYEGRRTVRFPVRPSIRFASAVAGAPTPVFVGKP